MNKKQMAILRLGVDEWNEWREKTSERFPDLEGADLDGMKLHGIDLTQCVLKNAKMSGCEFENASFHEAQMQGAEVVESYFFGADFSDADLTDADLHFSSFENTNCFDTTFKNTDLSYTHWRGAGLHGASLEDANLHKAENYIFSANFIRNTRLNSPSQDPWSILKSIYTGPTMFWTFSALLMAFTPYIAKALFWGSFNRYQNSTDTPMNCEDYDCYSVLELVIGMDRSSYYFVIPAILITYNILRGFMTYEIGKMRDEEEQTYYTPVWRNVGGVGGYEEKPLKFWKGYKYLYLLHNTIKYLGYLAAFVFVLNAVDWLSQTIMIPK